MQKLTLLDFPGRVACTLFTGGCNFRCPFCHNASLVLPESMEDFFHMHKKGTAYRPLEPSVEVDMKAVFPFIRQVRKTDGSRPGDLLNPQGFAGSR